MRKRTFASMAVLGLLLSLLVVLVAKRQTQAFQAAPPVQALVLNDLGDSTGIVARMQGRGWGVTTAAAWEVEAAGSFDGYDVVWILPADVAEAWQTDREWIVGSHIFADGGGSGVSTFGYNSNNITFPQGTLDQGWLEGVQIILRPSARISRMTVNVMEIPAQTTDLGIYRVQVIDNRRR